MKINLVFLRKMLLFFCMGVILASCGRGNGELSKEFFNKKGSIGVVWSASSQKGEFYREGMQGLLDQAINNISSGTLPAKIQTISLSGLVDQHYLKKFGQEFTRRDFKANLVQLPLDKQSLKNYSKGGDKVFWIDFGEFKEKFGLDYVLYLEVPSFGAKQNFFGFIAIEAPKACAELNVYLVETKTNTLVGEFHSNKTIEVKDKWDNPPEYPEVVDAITQALQSGLEDAAKYFFEGK